jgi:two-component system, NtrC family, response regulator AtoC
MNAANITTTNINAVNHLAAPFRILVAEDEPEIRDYLQLALRRPNFAVDFAEDGEEVLNILARGVDTPALVILDVAMPRKDGITTLKEIRYRNLKLPVIMLSGVSSPADRIAAMESGANDFLTKPVSYDQLRRVVDGLLPLSHTPRPVGLSGKSELNLKSGNWIRGMEPLLNRLAASDVPVLLQGETGVGKEVLARHIHNQSSRAGKIFLKLNCAALPSELVESELFGYEKGAFTGAFKSTSGKFELANGGTILLDEIGDMDLRLQAKLLQVLQDREYHRIGAKEPTQVDVRVIAATHRDLEARIVQREFRQDLFYRLNVLNIVIPPLRERPDEIVSLATSFLKKHTIGDSPVPDIGPVLRAALLRHQWPGNIRELENVMRRYLVVRNSEMIIDELERLGTKAAANGDQLAGSSSENGGRFRRSTDLPPAGQDWFGKPMAGRTVDPAGRVLPSTAHLSAAQPEGENSELQKLEEAHQAVETEVIMKALYSTQWNRKRAASVLGVDYKALLYKMKKLGID